MGAKATVETKGTISMPKEDIKAQPCVPKGLKNIGNSCYMNASLQCLLQTPGLSEVLLNSVEGLASRPQAALLRAYRGLVLKQADAESPATAELRSLKRAIKLQYRQYGRFHQMDPTEFFVHVISVFEEVSQELRKRLADLFGVEIETMKKCKVCGFVKKSNSRMNSLAVPMKAADVEFFITNGESPLSPHQISCSERWTSLDIQRHLQATRNLVHPCLVLQSSSSIDRVLTRAEPFRKMNLHAKHLVYFDLEDESRLVEVKMYQRIMMTSMFLRVVLRKVAKGIEPGEFCRLLGETIEEAGDRQQCKVTIQNSHKASVKFSLFDPQFDARSLQSLLDEIPQVILRVRIDLRHTHSRVPKSEMKSGIRRIPAAISLEGCLDEFVDMHNMGEENMVECIECSANTELIEWSRLKSTSEYLVVCLQRYNGFETAKDTRIVHFSQELNLERCMSVPESLIYSLYAVIKHRGTFSNGHYTSCVRGPSGWHHCNDSSVSPVAADDLQRTLEEDAYVLFYQRKPNIA